MPGTHNEPYRDKRHAPVCSLPGCDHEAAFDIFCGPDRFTITHLAYACAFDRAEVMDRAAVRFPSVQWRLLSVVELLWGVVG